MATDTNNFTPVKTLTGKIDSINSKFFLISVSQGDKKRYIPVYKESVVDSDGNPLKDNHVLHEKVILKYDNRVIKSVQLVGFEHSSNQETRQDKYTEER